MSSLVLHSVLFSVALGTFAGRVWLVCLIPHREDKKSWMIPSGITSCSARSANWRLLAASEDTRVVCKSCLDKLKCDKIEEIHETYKYQPQ